MALEVEEFFTGDVGAEFREFDGAEGLFAAEESLTVVAAGGLVNGHDSVPPYAIQIEVRGVVRVGRHGGSWRVTASIVNGVTTVNPGVWRGMR